ncbi:cupin domain-containing protein [Halomarina ordinaria]|uniref:Cupin domain-containing protein n=1 Tax=Halomarina ordinaria TaxID=3033939 RepID=A0ABD5U731_9EURY|nr:cupin domain-containing protein [Halomarina sp. PSRA2]
MKKVALDEVRNEPNPLQVHEVRKPVSKVLDTSDFAMNYFELDAGESFSGGLHTHHDQEEVFYIQEGTATFEVRDDVDDETSEVDVGPDAAVRFAPGEFQQGVNKGEERVVGLALGAPGATHDWDDIESVVYCPDCGEETGHSLALVDGRFEMTCNECGYEHD